MMKTKIAIDIDEVLAEFVKLYIGYVNKREGKNVCFEDFNSYNFWEHCSISKELSYRYADEIYEFLEDGGIVDGAKEVIEYLKENFELFFLTARPLKAKDKTLNFIRENFSIKNVYFSSDYFPHNKTPNKVSFCREFNISYLIEDNPDFFGNHLGNGLKGFLLDKPWNQDFEQVDLVRCSGWEDLIEKLKEIENGN